MNDAEMRFWENVYVATIRAGRGFVEAKMEANQAMAIRREFIRKALRGEE